MRKDDNAKKKPELKNILKNINLGNKEPNKGSVANKESIAPKKTRKKQPNTVLDNTLEVLKTKEYSKTRNVFIDEEVHEIFSLIKKHKKISIGGLLSFLGENFISENIKEITDINNNQNKYLK